MSNPIGINCSLLNNWESCRPSFNAATYLFRVFLYPLLFITLVSSSQKLLFATECLMNILLVGRYNPENLSVLEKYVNIQVQENTYDLEANLAVLKL